MIGTHSVQILLLLAALTTAACAQPAWEIAWNYSPPASQIDASPAVGDVDGDGAVDVIAAVVNGDVIALDGAGHERWRAQLSGRLCSAPALADVNGAPGLEVLLLNREGVLFCLDGPTGNRLWEYKLDDGIEWGATGPVAADLEGGATRIIVCANSGTVVCLDGDGNAVWAEKTDIGKPRWPAVVDVTGDAKREILVAGDGAALVCLSSVGKELWRVAGPLPGSSPIAGDFDGDGKPDIAVGLGPSLALLDGEGHVRWTVAMSGDIDSALCAADADGNGVDEIYAADLQGRVLCVTPDGAEVWTTDAGERVRRAPAVADVDGDGAQEILVAGYSGVFQVYAPGGNLEDSIPLPGGATNSTPTVALLADGMPHVICPTYGEQMPVFRWPAARGRDCRVLVSEYRGNAARTGVAGGKDGAAEITTELLDIGQCYAGANEFRVVMANPERRSLTLSLEVRARDRAPWSAQVSGEKERLEAVVPYMVQSDRAEDLDFSCVVTEGGRVLFKRSQHAFLMPFQRELADFRAAVRAAKGYFARMSDARGLTERIAFLDARLPELIQRVDAATSASATERNALRDELRGLLAELNRMVVMAQCAVERCDPAKPLYACAANPWAPFGGIDELAEGRFGVEGVIETFRGESECAAVNVFNLSGATRCLRVEIAAPAAGAVSVREVVETPTQARDTAADALPRLNEGALLVLPPWEARQLWLDVDAAKLEPGEHAVTVRLRSVEQASIDVNCALPVRVWEAALPEAQPLHLCHWGYVHSSCIKDYPEEALADQVDLGTNVFVGVHYPKATFDASGNLTGEIDFAEHDEYVRRHAPHGIILFCGYQGALQGPAKPGEEAYRRAHIAWLRAWTAHLAELGVGYDGFALYPVDEPGLSEGLVETFLLYAQLAREADPKIQVYTDPVARITMEELERMAPYVDIWCPNRNGFLLEQNADKLAFLKAQGKTTWTYECEDNVKHQSPLGYYRAQAWLVWHHGLTGIGFWSYCTSQNDPWFAPADSHEYLIIYPGQGVVRSKRWYAVRDGIEDYAMLARLRDAAEEASAAGRTPEAVARVAELVGETASRIGAFCGDDTTPGREGLAGMRAEADAQWQMFRETRRAIAEALGQLGKD